MRPRLLLYCFALLFVVGSPAGAATAPAGTVIEIRLEQPISSYSTHEGTKISGVLIAPVAEGGKLLLPLGATVEGSVVEVRRVGIGLVRETATIQLRFDRITLSNGTIIPLECRITEVDNARESVDAKGRIRGIRSTSTLSNRASGIVGSLAFGDPIAAIFTTTASASVLRFSEPEISLPVGAELTATLTAPLNIPQAGIDVIPPVAASNAEQEDLNRLVQGLPFRTYTNKSEIPSDITNLIFIGSANALEHAFADSGWVEVDPLTAESTYATIRSVAENQGYHAAPMSTLLLDGNPPAYAYSKTLNTFSKRHHLRIWSSTAQWNGQNIWTSSSTHDIGIGFSKKDKTFIHLIDSHIDNERAKVVNDLTFTGCVSAVQLVARPAIPKDAKNGTGEALITDDRVAVLELNDCHAPTEELPEIAANSLAIHGNRADRVTRQTVLTLKNNILRDNVGVMTYSGIRYAIDAKKKHEDQRPVRTMEIEGDKYTIDRRNDVPTSYSSSRASIAKSNREDEADRWAPPTVELGIRSSWTGYAGGNGGAIGFIFDSTNPPGDNVTVVLANQMDQGWNIGGSVTINANHHLSHEFSYNRSVTNFNLGLGVVHNDTTSGSIESAFVFGSAGLLTSEVAYNLLVNTSPRRSRLRPYLAIGPALLLMHLDEAPIKKAPGFFRLGLSNIGLISAAYNFGSTPRSKAEESSSRQSTTGAASATG